MRVLHLTGSTESAFLADLSRLYAADCLEVTRDPARYDVCVADIAPDGTGRFAGGVGEAQLRGAEPVGVADAVTHLVAIAPDVMVPHLFCRAGMTHLRALFDVLGIPYVGNGPAAMALAADKARARTVVAAAGVAVPDGEVVRHHDEVTLAPPLVVKPLDADNSSGVSLVTHVSELPAAVAEALDHADAALAETLVAPGREVRCGVLERDDGELRCLPLEEYAVSAECPIRHLDDKIADDGALRLVAKTAAAAWIVPDDDPVVARVHEAARRCHRALGCRHYSLFDFRVDAAGRPWFLEAGLYCSFARQSVVCTMARVAGIDTQRLFAEALDLACEGVPCR